VIKFNKGTICLVQQGSVLSPILYILYTADIPSLFAKYLASGHLYVRNFCAWPSPATQLSLVRQIASLLSDLSSCM